MPIKCAIIDDEPLARKVIRQYLEQVSWLQLTFEEGNPLEAINRLRDESVDLIFLDVKMPGITGLEFLNILQNRPKIILTTAYRDYALEGFEYEVIDYLLKPISLERFLKAVHKIPQVQLPESGPPEKQKPGRNSIIIKQDKKLFKVFLDEISHIEGLKDYVKVHTQDATYITYYTMQAMLEDLGSTGFMRVHKSFIINLQQFRSLEGSIISLGHQKVPLGRTYRESFVQRITRT
ncbi:MAG: response regulator transcription factor [Roseivirga sp.]|nr:response regulator transcription factor [Roseivirga sp.]